MYRTRRSWRVVDHNNNEGPRDSIIEEVQSQKASRNTSARQDAKNRSNQQNIKHKIKGTSQRYLSSPVRFSIDLSRGAKSSVSISTRVGFAPRRLSLLSRLLLLLLFDEHNTQQQLRAFLIPSIDAPALQLSAQTITSQPSCLQKPQPRRQASLLAPQLTVLTLVCSR